MRHFKSIIKLVMDSQHSVAEAVEAIKKGEMVIVVDNFDRENEGDLICAAELITPDQVNFMVKEARGLLCVSLSQERCRELELDLMVKHNTALHETFFTVSVDLLSDDVSTGISSFDRAKTIRALVDPGTKPSQLGRPGHIFPLIANKDGLLGRDGHTEAAIELTKLAGITPGAALIEIINDDGTMARLNDLMKFAAKYQLIIISVSAIKKYLLLTKQ